MKMLGHNVPGKTIQTYMISFFPNPTAIYLFISFLFYKDLNAMPAMQKFSAVIIAAQAEIVVPEDVQ